MKLIPFRQNGVTGLDVAANNNHLEVVRLLLDRRADPNAANKVRRHTAAPVDSHGRVASVSQVEWSTFLVPDGRAASAASRP